MFLETLLRRRRLDGPATAIYGALVAQARAPGFYRALGVPDTPEGRFEMIALHAFLVLNRLKRPDTARTAGDGELGQALFDLMFTDMDRNLREMGIGDLGVAKRVKALARGFYGRIAAYDRGLEDGEGLEEALVRNVYGGRAPGGAAVALAAYTMASLGTLRRLSLEDIRSGTLAFAPVPGPLPEQAEDGAEP